MDELFRAWALLGAGMWLAACAPDGVGEQEARQFTVECPQEQRLFVADTRNGIVQAIAWRDRPVLLAQLHLPGGASVNALAADASCQRLWVRGGEGAYVYDVKTLDLVGEAGVAAMEAVIAPKGGLVAAAR